MKHICYKVNTKKYITSAYISIDRRLDSLIPYETLNLS